MNDSDAPKGWTLRGAARAKPFVVEQSRLWPFC
jgi:hypothetical protein